MTEQKKQLIRRRLKGTVISTKMDKTVVVLVDRTSIHSKYLKRFTLSQKFHAHDQENAFQEGDIVTIEETRPYSKMKKWRVVGKVK